MGNLYSRYVFQPPPEPTYEDRGGRIVFLARDHQKRNKYNLHEEPIRYLTTSHGSSIPYVYIEKPNSQFTLIYAHGNADDLGLAAGQAYEISQALQVNIFAFEYTGYGRSSGKSKPSEEYIYNDIHAVWKHLVWGRGISPRHLIAVGRSIGTAAAIYIGTKRTIGGCILIAPVASAIRVALKKAGKLLLLSKILKPIDSLLNIERITMLNCPLLIIHGTNDNIVPKSHGESLIEKAKYPVDPLWISGAKHNNICEDFHGVVFERFEKFLEEVALHSRDERNRNRGGGGGNRKGKRIPLKRRGNNTKDMTLNDMVSTGKSGHRASVSSSYEELIEENKDYEQVETLDTRHGFSGRRPTPVRTSLSSSIRADRPRGAPIPRMSSSISNTPKTSRSGRYSRTSSLHSPRYRSSSYKRSKSFRAGSIESIIWQDDIHIDEENGGQVQRSSVTSSGVNSSLLISTHMALGHRVSLASSISMPTPNEYLFGKRLDKLERLKTCFRGY